MRTSTFLLTALLMSAGVAETYAADGDPATSNLMSGGITIPYDGFLMLDNQPMAGTRVIRFELWDDPSATTAANLRYSETQTVTLYNGHFSVAIGQGTQIGARTLDETVLDGDRLYIAMAIEDAGGTFVPLVGRQAIEAVPYSAWTGNAADMTVAGDLTVGGQVMSSLDVVGNVSATGTFESLGLARLRGGVVVSGTDNQIGALRVRTLLGNPTLEPAASNDSLWLSGGSSDDRVFVDGELLILGGAQMSGDIEAQSNTWSGTCQDLTPRRISHPSSNARSCPDGMFVAGMNFTRQNAGNTVNDLSYVLTCCPL